MECCKEQLERKKKLKFSAHTGPTTNAFREKKNDKVLTNAWPDILYIVQQKFYFYMIILFKNKPQNTINLKIKFENKILMRFCGSVLPPLIYCRRAVKRH